MEREAAMMWLSRVFYGGIAVAVLASVTACAEQPAPTEWREPSGAVAIPVAATSPSPAQSRLGERPTPKSTPGRPPTVAKIQRWVKIFSGPSLTDITPPRDPGRGSHVLELNAVRSDQIGTYVTDGAGRTLYRFDEDSAKPPKSTCNGYCARVWRPMLIKSPGKIYPHGINPKTVGYIERLDHTCQVTINGHPVYFFVGDVRPGDVNGQGVNGTWFAVAPGGGRTRPFPNSIQPAR
jgi:predicted lipoprotein with Yx(FWY)xxD motif